jgi:hypothetical protein
MPTIIVEDELGTVKESMKSHQKGILALDNVDMDDDGSDDDKDGEGMGWEDAYEQEIRKDFLYSRYLYHSMA